MKKKLSVLVLITFSIVGLIQAQNYDFSAVSSSGHTLYYKIVTGGVEIVAPGGMTNEWTGYTMPIGNLVIDSIVTYGDTSYSVVSIGLHAFISCQELTSVVIRNSVKRIKPAAFEKCRGLLSVSIPNSVRYIGSAAFWLCSSLTSISIPSSADTLENVFWRCTNLSTVFFNVENCVSRRPDMGIIDSCSNLSYVSIGKNVRRLPNNLFSKCNRISTVNYDAINCTSVADSVFGECPNLSTVTIGTDVQNIPGNLFAGHNSINTVNYNAINCTSAGSNENGRPFNGCTNITNVNIGEGVQIIPPYLFCGCSRLISIRIPDATTEIGRFAFASCTSLSSAIIGNGTTKIGEYSFNNCLRLTSVILGENIFSIEKHAFENCGIIGELVLPQSVTTIGYEGFKDCFGINKITCLGRVAPVLETDYYYPDVFAGVDSNISINIPCGSTNMYAGRWARFHNFHEMPFVFYAISENNNKGTVTIEQQPSCADPYAVIRATPKPGYHFDHWSDGNTSNPYSYTATGSTTLIGYFGRNAGIEDVESDDYRIVTENGSIKVLGVENMNVIIYDMMGRCVAMANTGASIAVPNSGVYMVKVGNLPIKKVVMLK